MRNMGQALASFANNTFSQYGEDGIIGEVLRRISEHQSLDHWCVEFGAWDGVFLSNTCHLIRNNGYSAVLIEADAERIATLKRNFPQENVHIRNEFVTFEGPSALDNILGETPIPQNFDFLSIDIDGLDYHVLESLVAFRPKVICIEFNPAIPNSHRFVQAKDWNVRQGSSARAIHELAAQKGYRTVCATTCNLIIVDEAYADHVLADAPSLEALYPEGNDAQILFVGFDGSLHSNKPVVGLTWHNLEIPIEKLQPLPKRLQKFPDDYSAFDRFLYGAYLLAFYPREGVKYVRSWLKR